MKKILLLGVLLIGMTGNSQGIRFGEKENFTASLSVDPMATIKEKSPNVVAEIELVSYWKYVKASVQVLPSLQGGYLDLAGGLGLNLTSGYFEQMRYYGGIRLGVIKRGFTEDETYTYPLFGFEGGINYNVTDKFFIGIRATSDYRSDFKYSGAKPFYRNSGFVKLGFNF
jgi:hypothetical protein